MKKKISVGWVIVILFIFYFMSSFVGDNTFEDFLAREKNIYSDGESHKHGWNGPEGKLDWKSSAEQNAGIYIKYSYTFIKEDNEEIEVSAIKIFGIWIDLTKSNQ